MRRGNDCLRLARPTDRKRLLRREARLRRTGEWGEWRVERFAPGSCGDGWAAQFMRAHVNRVFSVLARDLVEGWVHLAVSSLSGQRPTWPEAQRIKSELAGPDRTAVEVYPPEDEIVDGADMYHLWVLPADRSLAASLFHWRQLGVVT